MLSREITFEQTLTGVMLRDLRTGAMVVRCVTGERAGQELVDRLTYDPRIKIIEILETVAGSDIAREFYLGESAVS